MTTENNAVLNLTSPRSVGMRGIRGASLYPTSSAVCRTGRTRETSISAKCGFTLIELLVVVLIIGILAAIALPQYQLVVQKPKYIYLKALMQRTIQEQHLYYLTNGNYTKNLSDLSIFDGWQHKESDGTENYTSPNGIYLCGIHSYNGGFWCKVNKDQTLWLEISYQGNNKKGSCSYVSYDKVALHQKLCAAIGGTGSANKTLYF